MGRMQTDVPTDETIRGVAVAAVAAAAAVPGTAIGVIAHGTTTDSMTEPGGGAAILDTTTEPEGGLVVVRAATPGTSARAAAGEATATWRRRPVELGRAAGAGAEVGEGAGIGILAVPDHQGGGGTLGARRVGAGGGVLAVPPLAEIEGAGLHRAAAVLGADGRRRAVAIVGGSGR